MAADMKFAYDESGALYATATNERGVLMGKSKNRTVPDHLTSEQVQEEINFWQSQLGLQDWDIRYSPDHPTGKRAYGEVRHFSGTRKCQLLLKRDLPSDLVAYVVCHELLHILLSPVTGWKGEHNCADAELVGEQTEQIVNALAEAMTGTAIHPLSKGSKRWFPSFVAS